MKKAILCILLLGIITSYGISKTVVKLLLPANCKASTTVEADLKNDNASKLMLFPNPNDGRFSFNVRFKSKIDKATISIYNTVGKIVYTEIICSDSESFNGQLSLSGLLPGVYFVIVDNVNQEVSTKLVIK